MARIPRTRLRLAALGPAAIALALAPAVAPAGPDDRSAIRSLDRRIEALDRRYGSGPSAARRLRVEREAERLGDRLDRRLTQPGSSVGRSRANLRALERRLEEIDDRRRESALGGGADGGSGRLLDIRIPETDLDPSDLRSGPPVEAGRTEPPPVPPARPPGVAGPS